MTVRNFIKTDYEKFLEYSDKFYNSGAALCAVDSNNFKKTFDAALQKTAGLEGFIIEENNETAGYCLVNFFWSSEAGGVVGMIDEFFVDEKFRGQGLGKKFLNYLFDEYKDISAFRLEVCDSNKGAIKLYKSYGFDYLDYKQMIKKM